MSENMKIAVGDIFRAKETIRPFYSAGADYRVLSVSKSGETLSMTDDYGTDTNDGAGHGWYATPDFFGMFERVNPTVEKIDNVNSPSHYNTGGIECFDAMQAMLTREEMIGYLRGNSFKYRWRFRHKGGAEDLRKAEWYEKKLLDLIENSA